MLKSQSLYVLICIFITLLGCTSVENNKRFIHLNAEKTGIDFSNVITEDDEINAVNFQYCYNGGGVGIGDFDNDGRPDIVFTGNQVPSKIYLNKGDLTFEDISQKANFITDSWVTGVSIVDINSDGKDDIYLNVGGANCNADCNNVLFINQGIGIDGIPTFIEQAAAYGLSDGNYSQQSVFFDYDGDGDLDVYILHNGNSGTEKNNPTPKRHMQAHLKDFLLRNDTVPGVGHPVFTDISQAAGIVHGGFGLGVGINDFNDDGLVDIYVANDFITEDLLYIQRRHEDSIQPWFVEKSKELLGHESYNAMGVDFQDVNNDTRPDIMVVDMLPGTYERHKKMLGTMNYERYLLSQRNDYSSQYVHNTLQLNNGKIGSGAIKSSEVAFLRGISSTDWSWAPLMVDLDNDADKDLYISNGYVKDVADLDYINYAATNNMFGSTEDRLAKKIEFTKQLDSIYLPNFIYENRGDLDFKNVSNDWAVEKPSYSNGVAFADLDADGDLDLIVNNINEKAFILKNTTDAEVGKHYLRIELIGPATNPKAIGAKVTLWDNGKVQGHFQSVIRGYLSSMESIVHFGVADNHVDSLQIQWPNGGLSRMKNITADQVLTFDVKSAKDSIAKTIDPAHQFRLNEGFIDFVHDENSF
ncbi:CRTAC1 family protein, partial [Maribacter sp.]|nr:CRTAC1 family protein [Maribacter sp.]